MSGYCGRCGWEDCSCGDPTPTPSGEACDTCKSLGLSARDCERGRIHPKAEPAQPAGTQATQSSETVSPEAASKGKTTAVTTADKSVEYSPSSSGPSPATETAREWREKHEDEYILENTESGEPRYDFDGMLAAYHAAQSAADDAVYERAHMLEDMNQALRAERDEALRLLEIHRGASRVFQEQTAEMREALVKALIPIEALKLAGELEQDAITSICAGIKYDMRDAIENGRAALAQAKKES